MLRLVAEGAGHTAAARIHPFHARLREHSKQAIQSLITRQRPAVAVAMALFVPVPLTGCGFNDATYDFLAASRIAFFLR